MQILNRASEFGLKLDQRFGDCIYKRKLASLKSVQDLSFTEPLLLLFITTTCARPRLGLFYSRHFNKVYLALDLTSFLLTTQKSYHIGGSCWIVLGIIADALVRERGQDGHNKKRSASRQRGTRGETTHNGCFSPGSLRSTCDRTGTMPKKFPSQASNL